MDPSPPHGSGAFHFDRLLHAARQGSTEALGELFEFCKPYLLKIANVSLPQNLQAKTAPSDIVQDTFFRASRSIADFRGQSQGEFHAWLKRILGNAVNEKTRAFNADKRKGDVEFSLLNDKDRSLLDCLAESGLSPGGIAQTNELVEHLRNALIKLTEDERRVIQLRVYEQLSFAEVAVRLERPEEASRKFFERTIEKLRGLLDAHDET